MKVNKYNLNNYPVGPRYTVYFLFIILPGSMLERVKK